MKKEFLNNFIEGECCKCPSTDPCELNGTSLPREVKLGFFNPTQRTLTL